MDVGSILGLAGIALPILAIWFARRTIWGS